MTDIIFPGVAKQTDGLNIYLRKEFGITGRRVAADLVVSAADIAKGFASRDFLRIGPQIALEKGKEVQIAGKLYALISEEVKKYQPPPSVLGQVHSSTAFDLLSKVAAVVDLLAVQEEGQVVRHLAEEIIPLMRDRLNAQYVTGVTVDAEALQGHISFAKIALLADRYDVAQAQKLVLVDKALGGILPSSFEPLSYLDALTRFSPLALTLPIHRANCAWHFQTDAMWSFAPEAVNGIMPEFMMSISPLAADSSILGLHGLRDMDESNIWRFLKLAVVGLNRLLSYLIDPRNFADSASGRVDFMRQVQAHSALRLLFADIAAINYSTAAHQRISFAFSALDKLSNLRVELGVGGKEPDAFKALCSESQRDELITLYVESCKPLGYDRLAQALSQTVTRCFDDLHSYLGQQGAASSSEMARLDRLRSQRNVRHGAFLQGSQFEKLFLESHGNVPATLGSLSYLLVFGLLSDPKRFLAFQPVIRP